MASRGNSVGVIIRCRDEEAHIARLLTGLQRQLRPPDETFVVDSGSTDATLAIAASFGVNIVHIRPEDFSFGAACNVGLEACTADVAVFVSAHCYPVHTTWLESLVAPLEDPTVALSYGKQVGPPEARFSEQRLFAQWFPETSELRQRIPFCNNANSAIRSQTWRDGLRFDEELTGLEDLEWAKRAMEAGHSIAYVAEAPVVHVHNEHFGQIVNRYRREAIAQRSIYDEHPMRLRHASRLALWSIARDAIAARKQGLGLREFLDIPRFRAAQYYGTFRGFSQSGKVPGDLRRRFYFPESRESTASSEALAPQLGDTIDYENPRKRDADEVG